MITENLENEIFRLALEAFKKNVALQVEVEAIEPTYKHLYTYNLYKKADRILRVMIQDIELRFYTEVKANITKAAKLLILMRKNEVNYPFLLVTRYVNAEMAEQLKSDGLQFIDAAGNAFINQPPLYIFIKGNKPQDIGRRAPHKRVFKPTGLRVLYAFLCNPGLEKKPYREIATVADVALGTIGWIMRELKELGYLLDMGKQGVKLIQKENLFQRWVIDYPEKLRPKLMLGRFRGIEGWWQQKTLNPLNAQWGGEVAAAKLTKYLKPQMITVYTAPPQLNPFLIENRLKKDPQGDVEILERFWQPLEAWPYKDVVHPILIYTDLMATGNHRNMETAKMIYDQYIVQLIRED